MTSTSTPTNTLVNTATPTSTPSSTPTAVTVSASQGPNPPGNSNQLSGATNVPVQQVVLTNPSSSTVTLTSLTLTVSGTGNPSDITSVTLLDNGTPLVTTAFTYTTATFSLSQTLLGSSSVTYTVQANFGTNAAGGYTFSLTGASGTNGQAVLFSGLPVAGATVSVAQATSTPTNSYTPTTTASNTPSGTATLIPTLTFTPTYTSTPSHTSTSTPNPPTSTATSTPVGNTGVVVYPNPATGDTVNVLPPTHSGMEDVRVEIFTSAFRKVLDESFASVPPGVAVTVELKDKWGRPLADGLYYVVVTVDGKRSIAKLLVLR